MIPVLLTALISWSASARLCDRAGVQAIINEVRDSEAPFHTIYMRPRLMAAFAECRWDESTFGLPKGSVQNYLRRTATKCYRRLGHELSSATAASERHETLQDFEMWKACLDYLKDAGLPVRMDPKMAEKIEQRFRKAQEAYAKERKKTCSEKILTGLPGLGHVRDQGNAGWCFAHSAADLASVYFGKKISAVDLALSHHDEAPTLEFFRKLWSYSPAQFDRGGWSERALRKGSERGFCLEENFRSDDQGQAALVDFYKQLKEYAKDGPNLTPHEISSLYRRALLVAPRISLKDFSAAVTHPDTDGFFNRFRDQACAPRIHGEVPMEFGQGSIAGSLDSALYQNSPASLGYFYDCTENKSNLDGRHASTVVGRRFNDRTGSCEYLVRNSWGESFRRGDAPAGHFWVSEYRINRCGYSATALRRSGPAIVSAAEASR